MLRRDLDEIHADDPPLLDQTADQLACFKKGDAARHRRGDSRGIRGIHAVEVDRDVVLLARRNTAKNGIHAGVMQLVGADQVGPIGHGRFEFLHGARFRLPAARSGRSRRCAPSPMHGGWGSTIHP